MKRLSLEFLATLVLSLIGVGTSVYLTIVHYSPAALVCSSSGFINCGQVLNSSYALIAGTTIPTAVAGILWFLVIIGLRVARSAKKDSNLLATLQLLWAAIGVLAALDLIYAEIVKINAICLWCTVVHVLVFLILILTLISHPKVKNWLKN